MSVQEDRLNLSQDTANNIILSIVIINYNAPELITKCLHSIDKYIVNITKEVVIVDNNSQQECLCELQKRFGYLKIIRLPKNTGVRACNVGVKNSSGEMILLLNTDTEITDYSINEALAEFYKNRKKVLWGFKLIYPDGSFQNSFSREIGFTDFIFSYTPLTCFSKYIKRIGYHRYSRKPLDKAFKVLVIYFTAALLWKEDFCELNGYDTKYFMYFEDIDFCDRFRNDFKGEIYYYPSVCLIHSAQGSLRAKQGLNYPYLRSKYKYGLAKFKVFRMAFFIFFDVVLIIVSILCKKLLNRKISTVMDLKTNGCNLIRYFSWRDRY